MSDKCFICLTATRNKVCGICKCYCHPGCWGKYIKEKTDISTYICSQKVEMKYNLYVRCPICNSQIGNIKPLTRSDTLFLRRSIISVIISNKLKNIKRTEIREEKTILIKDLQKILDDNIYIIPKNCVLYKIVKEFIDNNLV